MSADVTRESKRTHPNGRVSDGLFYWSIEDAVDNVERHHAGAHHRAGGHGPPQDVRSGEIPDSQKRSDDRDDDAGAGDPERQFGHDAGVEKASFHKSIIG